MNIETALAIGIFPIGFYYYFIKKVWKYEQRCPGCGSLCKFGYRFRDGIRDNYKYYVVNCESCGKGFKIKNTNLVMGGTPSFIVADDVIQNDNISYTILKNLG